jgi:FkbM family methyltransferase
MGNFYKLFIEHYFGALSKEKTTYKSCFRNNMHKSQKMIYYYEIILDSITSILSKNKLICCLIFKNNYFIQNIQKFEATFNLLKNELSKKKYVQYIVFKAINSNRLKLNFDIEDINNKINEMGNLQISKNENYSTNIGPLHLYNLSAIGYKAKLINNPIGVLIDFVYEQYAYDDLIATKKGDVVIDCGGAIGDTAIYFASKGASKVLVVEFIKSNIELIKKQISLNNQYTKIIDIIDKPLWDKSDLKLSYMDKGTASKVSFNNKYPNKIQSVSIDDLAAGINVDFIKMDIEGSELHALRGAEKTIKKHKPKLAICVYHKADDLVEIPKYIKSLNKDYEFYFDYYTDIGWEAVLYAIDKGIKE